MPVPFPSPRATLAAALLLLTAACARSSAEVEPGAAAPAPADTAPPATPPASATSASSTMAAAAPAGDAALEPTGNYSYETEVNGNQVVGQIRVTRANGALGGEITSNAFPAFPLTSVETSGRTMRLVANTGDSGMVNFKLDFTGDDFVGEWEQGGMSGRITGKRVR